MYCSLSSYSMGNLAPSIARGNRRSKESQDRDPSELAVAGRAESDVSGIYRIGSKACALLVLCPAVSSRYAAHKYLPIVTRV